MSKYLLGLDAGTTSFKAAIFTDEGELVCARGRDYKLISPQPDIVEFSPGEYWNVLCGLLHELIPASGIHPADIAALAISSQGETLICLDDEGKAIGNAIVWLDNRAEVEANELRERFGKREVYERTGQPDVTATWTACKILWLKKNKPDIFKRTRKFMLLEDYLIYRLTDRIVCEPSLLASTIMYDVQNECWWGDMLDCLGIDEARLPEVVPCGGAVAPVTKHAARKTRLVEGTLVAAGALDQICGIVGSGVIRPGVVAESTGSCLAVTANLAAFAPWRVDRPITCQNHAIPGRFVIMQWCQTAGMVLKWFVSSFYRDALMEGRDVYKLVDDEAAEVPPGCDGMLMLPHLLGAQTPEYDMSAKGVFYGITLAHTRGHFARAIMEAVGFMLRRNLEEIGGAGPLPDEIFSLGGGSKSALWSSIKADITGMTVRPVAVSEAACLGASLLAGVACGLYGDIDSASAKHLRAQGGFEPNPANRAAYDEAYARYIELYEALKPVFARAAGAGA